MPDEAKAIAVERMTIAQMGESLRSGRCASADLVHSYLGRIDRLNPKLNAYIRVFGDEAMEAARRADAELAAGKDRGALHGIPIALKDNIDVKGWPTTAGGVLLPAEPAHEDAEAVSRLRDAGAVLLGKLNMHEYAWGGTTDNPHHGRCGNPWRQGFTAGGSSGGSGAAVAARLCAAALGTDTLGSIRIPASYCGVVGLKPSNGLVSARGVFPLSWPLDTVGPLAACVEDAELLLRAIAGPDEMDPYSMMVELEDLELDDPPPLNFLRIGVVKDWALAHDGTPARRAVAEAVGRAIGGLMAFGCRRADLDLPEIHDAQRAAMAIAFADAASIHKERMEKHPGKIGPDVLERLRRGAAMTGPRVAEAHHARQFLRRRISRAARSVDILASPTMPTPAHAFDPNLSQMTAWFTAPFNLLGWPAITVSCGFHDGLPNGLMLAAPPFEERKLFRLARAFEDASGWKGRRPFGA